MADKGKGKAVEDTDGTSSQTSEGWMETAFGGGTWQELQSGASSQFGGAPGGGGGSGLSQSQWRLPTTTTLQQPLSNQAGGSAPFRTHAPSGQNQIANPWQTGTGQPHGNSGASSSSSQFGGGGGGPGVGFGGFSQFAGGSAPFGIHAPSSHNGNPQFGGGGGGGGSGAGYGGSYQSTPMLQPPVGNPGLGHGGFSQPAPMLRPTLSQGLGNPAFHAGQPCTPAAAVSVERKCTICKIPTPELWRATTVQGTRVVPLCEHCHSKIFAGGRPLQHLEQYLESTAAGCGAGSIPEFLAARGIGGRFSHCQQNPAHAPVPLLRGFSPWCVRCNCLAERFWDWLPMCTPCYNRPHPQHAPQAQAPAQAQAQAQQAQAQAQAQAQQAQAQAQQAQVQAQQAQAQGRGIGQQRQLDSGQPSSAAPEPHAQGCRSCGAAEPTRMFDGIPLCEKCCPESYILE